MAMRALFQISSRSMIEKENNVCAKDAMEISSGLYRVVVQLSTVPHVKFDNLLKT